MASSVLQKFDLAAAQVPSFSSLLPSGALVNLCGSNLAGVSWVDEAHVVTCCYSQQKLPTPFRKDPALARNGSASLTGSFIKTSAFLTSRAILDQWKDLC